MSLSLFPLVSHSYHYPFHSRNYESEFATLTSNPSTPNGDHLSNTILLAPLANPLATLATHVACGASLILATLAKQPEFATLTSSPSTPNGAYLILATLDKPSARHARLFNTIIIVSALADPIPYLPTLRSEHPALGTNTYKMCFAPH